MLLRKWLRLPNNQTNYATHVLIPEGGLGISFTLAISAKLKQSQLKNMAGIHGEEDDEAIANLPHI